MDFNRCPNCLGNKKILEMGMIEKECKRCSGVGYIDKKNTIVPVEKPIVRKRRVRQKEATHDDRAQA